MVDFGKMLAEELQEKPMSPLEIFQSSVRPEEYEYLRACLKIHSHSHKGLILASRLLIMRIIVA